MEITYLGHSSFKIKGKTTTVITDPYDSDSVGLKFPKKIEADIVTISHDHTDHNAKGMIDGSPFIVNCPGEYEIKGVGIVGVPTFHDDEKGAKRGKNTMFRLEMEGVSIVHLGDLGHVLSSAEVDTLDGVNILLVPVGGVYTIDPVQAVAVITDIGPSIVIPMHYSRDGLNEKAFAGLAGLPQFLKEIGKEGVIAQPKLSITKDKMPAEMQVVVLE
jgi:L-ascorbate metabolism protein UlaG (beta-lactamase superfamily)